MSPEAVDVPADQTETQTPHIMSPLETYAILDAKVKTGEITREQFDREWDAISGGLV